MPTLVPCLSPILFGDGEESLADLDVVVAGDLDLSVDRHHIRRDGRGQQKRRLGLGEHLRRAGARAAVDALAGLVAAPRLGAALGVGQIGEVFPGEEVVPHVLHHPLHPWFVPRLQLRSIRSVISELFG